MRDIILEARNLSYSYEDSSSPALNGLSLSIARGSKIAVMGANGSGKSTLMKYSWLPGCPHQREIFAARPGHRKNGRPSA